MTTITMKLQHQTTFGGADAPPEKVGNCYATCIASLLGEDVVNVPNFCKTPDGWFDRTQAWLLDRGFMVVPFKNDPFENTPDLRKDAVMIAAGMGPRGHRHAVLWKNGELFHDPHPSGDGLAETPDEFEMIMAVGK